jgi:hypothetical protein
MLGVCGGYRCDHFDLDAELRPHQAGYDREHVDRLVVDELLANGDIWCATPASKDSGAGMRPILPPSGLLRPTPKFLFTYVVHA